MENYLDEIINACKLPFSEVVTEFKVIQIGNKIIYIGNFKKILDYSNNRVALKTSKEVVEIVGNNLLISQINKNEIIIKGDIYSFGVAQ